MIEIAGGIILAVVFFASLPFLITMLGGLIGGLIVGAVYILNIIIALFVSIPTLAFAGILYIITLPFELFSSNKRKSTLENPLTSDQSTLNENGEIDNTSLTNSNSENKIITLNPKMQIDQTFIFYKNGSLLFNGESFFANKTMVSIGLTRVISLHIEENSFLIVEFRKLEGGADKLNLSFTLIRDDSVDDVYRLVENFDKDQGNGIDLTPNTTMDKYKE